MKTTITRTELKAIHDIACNDWKTKLAKYASKDPFNDNIEFTQTQIQEMIQACTTAQLPIVREIFDIQDTMSKIDSLKSAISYLGEKDEEVQQLRLLQSCTGLARYIVAEQELVVLTKALNEGEILDWDNHSQYKYYSWWYLGSNFRLSCVCSDYDSAYCSARLCFKNRELAEYAADKFKSTYKDYMNK